MSMEGTWSVIWRNVVLSMECEFVLFRIHSDDMIQNIDSLASIFVGCTNIRTMWKCVNVTILKDLDMKWSIFCYL